MSNPYLVKIPFCNAGIKNTIQIERQPTQEPQDATYNDGFPPVTMIPETGGGIAPNGLDFNGIFYELSSPIAHYCRGDRIQFDSAYAVAIGGYDKGCILASNDYSKDYISLVDNNTVDPDGSNITGFWSIYAGQGSVPVATSTTTGTVKLVNSLSSTATDAALTAAQGKTLQDTKLAKTDVINALTSTSTTQALSAAQGKALNDKMLGTGQTWQNVTASRAKGITYTNSTARPIQVLIVVNGGVSGSGNTIVVGGVTIASFDVHTSMTSPFSFIVPAGQSYRINLSSTIESWAELR